MTKQISRREFVKGGLVALTAGALATLPDLGAFAAEPAKKPNLVFVFADQLRFCSLGCMGNEQVHTPHTDKLAAQGVTFANTYSGFPLCSPYRAMLLTGRYGHTTGVVSNNIRLPFSEITTAKVLKQQGYATGYVGKWHLDGDGKAGTIEQRSQGFDHWHIETGGYNKKTRTGEPLPDAHTDEAIKYIKDHKDKPFVLFLSWLPPHTPRVAPPKYEKMYDPSKIKLRPNVEGDMAGATAKYYAMITALDDNISRLTAAIKEAGIEDNTIVVYTSDHGDMIGSHNQQAKQRPWEESCHVPFIMRYPGRIKAGIKTDVLMNSVDIMPTLLGLMGAPIPKGVQGVDLSAFPLGKGGKEPESVFLQDIMPCGQAVQTGITEWRGVRTKRYTYARHRDKGWVLYDNQVDPYQKNNLIDKPEAKDIQAKLEEELQGWLDSDQGRFRLRRDVAHALGHAFGRRQTLTQEGKGRQTDRRIAPRQAQKRAGT